LDAGKLVLSPTRTYAPIIKKILDSHRGDIQGMVHCSGGAQTKVRMYVCMYVYILYVDVYMDGCVVCTLISVAARVFV
jgi:phosphoribosylaminoimidazole (AIR) synthetase